MRPDRLQDRRWRTHGHRRAEGRPCWRIAVQRPPDARAGLRQCRGQSDKLDVRGSQPLSPAIDRRFWSPSPGNRRRVRSRSASVRRDWLRSSAGAGRRGPAGRACPRHGPDPRSSAGYGDASEPCRRGRARSVRSSNSLGVRRMTTPDRSTRWAGMSITRSSSTSLSDAVAVSAPLRRHTRMRASSSPMPKGLATKSSAPRSSAAIFSASWSRAERTMIGVRSVLTDLSDDRLAVEIRQAQIEDDDEVRLRERVQTGRSRLCL